LAILLNSSNGSIPSVHFRSDIAKGLRRQGSGEGGDMGTGGGGGEGGFPLRSGHQEISSIIRHLQA
jgi:hypothetical protein